MVKSQEPKFIPPHQQLLHQAEGHDLLKDAAVDEVKELSVSFSLTLPHSFSVPNN